MHEVRTLRLRYREPLQSAALRTLRPLEAAAHRACERCTTYWAAQGIMPMERRMAGSSHAAGALIQQDWLDGHCTFSSVLFLPAHCSSNMRASMESGSCACSRWVGGQQNDDASPVHMLHCTVLRWVLSYIVLRHYRQPGVWGASDAELLSPPKHLRTCFHGKHVQIALPHRPQILLRPGAADSTFRAQAMPVKNLHIV